MVSFASSFLRFLLVSSFMISFNLFVSTVHYLSRVFLLGISCGFFPSFGVNLFDPLSLPAPRGSPMQESSLVDIATARRVGELPAVSCSVSFSGVDRYLSYLPEFRAKTESASNTLPRSFRVRSFGTLLGPFPMSSSHALCVR